MKTAFSCFSRFFARLVLCMGLVLTLAAPMAWADGDVVDAAAECGRLYEAQKDKEAFPICQRAAEAGDADAQVNLGDFYFFGSGVTQNKRKSVKWYRLAAEQENVVGQHILGWIYENGEGVSQDYRKALKWYRLAAEQGHVRAQYDIGRFYEFAKGVTQDYSEAVEWYQLAASNGYADAQNNLGVLYHNGKGVISDLREAFIWYSISASSGNENAQTNLGLIENQLSHSEIRSARAEAKSRLAAIKAGTYRKEAETPPSVATVPKDEGTTPAQTAFENVWRSVVYIDTDVSLGSGVIARPHIVATNCHVVEDANNINVYKAVDKRADKSTPFIATIHRYDFDRDVCLLDVRGLFGVPAQFRNADSLTIGESVYAVGAPDGYDLSLSSGVVSQLRRTDGYGAPTVQTDAAISPGSSGGALTDASGYVVAITTRKRVEEGVEGIGFAVPIEWVLEMLE